MVDKAEVLPVKTKITKDALVRMYNALVNEHNGFQDEVVEVARRYAKRYEWCEVVNEALSEMGLSTTRRVRVSFEFDIDTDETDASAIDCCTLGEAFDENVDTHSPDSVEFID